MKTVFSSLAVAVLTMTSMARAQVTALDSGFAPNIDGSVNVISSASAAGSYYVAGDFTQISSTARSRIARIAADGSLDATFDPGSSANSAIYALQRESGGGVLVAGGFTLFNGQARPALCRLTSSGAVDPAVSTTATVVTAMAVNSSKLYAAGSFPRSDAPGQYSFRIVRMAYPSGFTGNNYDPGYNEPTITGTVNALFFQADGKLIIGGDFTAVNGTARTNLARLNSDGSLDTTFSVSATGGPVRTLVDFAPGAGVVVVGGEFTALGGQTAASYYGMINQGTAAVLGLLQPRCYGTVRSIISYGYGEMLLGGDFTTIGSQSVSRMARVNVYEGIVGPALNINPNASVRAMLKDDSSQGRIVIGGAFTQVHTTTRNRLARLEPYGAINPAWPEATGGEVRAIAVQTNDASLVGGAFTALGGSPRTSLGRVLVTGTLDASYTPLIDGPVNAIAALPNGRAVIGGSFTTAGGGVRANIAQLNADGTVDVTFSADTDGEVFALSQQTDGKVYVAGDFTTIGGIARRGVARLNADGTVDTTFDAALDAAVMAVSVQIDGKVLLGGDFLTVGGTAHARLARVSSTGVLDATFVATAGGTVRTLNQDATGRVLVGGSFNTGSSFSQAWTVWLTNTGTTAPGSVTFVNNAMRTSTILCDGTTCIGGQFSNASDSASSSAGPLARLVGANVSPSLPLNTGAVVRTIAARSDGALLIGGSFTSFGDMARSNLGLWANAESAGNGTSVNTQTGAISWTRFGSLPSPTLVVFEISTDSGASWNTLGIGGVPTVSGNTWVTSLASSTLPINVPMQVRARGLVSDGVSSSWITAALFSGIRALPTITTQPVTQTVNQNASVTFTVAATSSSAMTYQWRKDGNPISGATNSTYGFTASNTNMSGTYSVVITNANGSTTSNDAVLTIRSAISITTQPVSTTVPQGTPAVFTVVAAGDSPTYQWQEYRYYSYPIYAYQWTNIAGETNASYSRSTSTTYQLRVTVSNAFSSAISNSVTATVVALPSISGLSYSQTINADSDLSLYVSLAHSPVAATYQWLKDDVPISGATNPNYQKTAALTDTGIYKVVVTNIAGSITSRTVTVNVMPNTAPVITRDLPSLMVPLGQPADFGVDYIGRIDMTFEWRRNGALLHWLTSPSFTVGGTMADSGIYTCKITNQLGSTTSRYASVAVVDTASSSLALPLHGTLTLKAPTTAHGVSYRWQKGGADLAVSSRIASVTSASLIIKDLTLADAGAYTCIIGNGATTITGGAVTLIVQDKVPTVTTTTLPDAQVAVVYDAQLTGSELPTKFTVSGLPGGLKCDTLGHITGTPTQSGTFPLKVIAANGVGKSATKLLSLKVLTLPTGLTGSWMGISGAHRIDATIATSGVMTGTIQILSVSRQFRTTVVISSATDGSISPCPISHPTFGNMTVNGTISLASGIGVNLNLNYDIPGIGQTTTPIILWSRAPITELPKFKGYYTAALANLNPSGYTVPEGSGYAAITIGSTGSTTVSGRLADGTAHSTTGFVGPNGEVGVFDAPITNKSFLNNVIRISLGTPPNYYDNSISGALDWSRSAIPGRLFPDGFFIQLSANGYKYLKPNLGLLTGPIVMNLVNAPGNAQLAFGIYNEGSGGASQGRISTSNQFSLKSGGAFSSASVTINAATGVFTASGTFSSTSYYNSIPVRRSGTGYGIIVSNPTTLGGLGVGYVILPLIPRNVGETLGNTPQVSGSVSLGSS